MLPPLMRCRMKHVLNFCLVFVAVLLMGANPAHSQTFTWLPTTGGLFDNAANWSPAGGPPANGDTTIFNSTATQTVLFQSSVFLATHEIENGNIVFQLNQTFNTMTGSGLIVGNIVNQTGRLTILNGTLAGDMSIGDVDASTGFFTIGPGATFDASSHITAVGNNGI